MTHMGVDLGIEPVWQFIARASSSRDKGDYQEAEFYARKAVFADQSVGAAYVLLCEILEKLGKKDEAERIDKALTPLFKIVGIKTTEKVKLPNGSTAEVAQKVPNPVPVKTMMAGLGMIDNLCKRPLGRLTGQGTDIVRNALRDVWTNYPKALEPIEGYYDVDVEKRLGDDRIWSTLSYK